MVKMIFDIFLYIKRLQRKSFVTLNYLLQMFTILRVFCATVSVISFIFLYGDTEYPQLLTHLLTPGNVTASINKTENV